MFIVIIFTVIINSNLSAQIYYVNTYSQANTEGTAVITIKSINLDSANVVDSLNLNNRGYIPIKKPVILQDNQRIYLLTLSQISHMSKNSYPADSPCVYYSVVTSNNGILRSIRSDSIRNSIIDIIDQNDNEQGFKFGLTKYNDTTTIYPSGIYTLNSDFRFRFLRPYISVDMPGTIHNIDSFDFITKLPNDAANGMYYGFKNSQWWLAKLNKSSNIIDSLQLRYSGGAATLFAYHPLRDKFYCFHLNYEMHTGLMDSVYKHREDFYVAPEVLIYDPITLELTNRYSIEDYPAGGYPGRENGLADVVGNFIVYYFFAEDMYYRYDPAVLFIFDTRTNEATWLRVGWR
jgi:hypothetical protein